MPPSWLLRRVALVRTEVSEERIASIYRVTRIGELGKTLAVTSNRHTLRRNVDELTLTANAVPSSLIVFTMLMEATRSSQETQGVTSQKTGYRLDCLGTIPGNSNILSVFQDIRTAWLPEL
jgi:hypothetical protein